MCLTTMVDTESIAFCRICREEDDLHRLVSPCKCKGTIGRVHASCLERWLSERRRRTCELCGHQYQVECLLRYSLTRALYLWFCTRRFHVLSLSTWLVATALMPLLCLYCACGQHRPGRWSALACFILLATLHGIYYCWLRHALHYHAARWFCWWQGCVTIRLVTPNSR